MNIVWMKERKRKAPKKLQAVIKVDEKNKQAFDAVPDLKTKIENRLIEMNRRRQQAKLEKQLLEEGSEVTPVTSGIDGAEEEPNLDLDDQVDTSPNDIEDGIRRTTSAQGGQQEDSMAHQDQHGTQPAATTHSSMTPQEKLWWSMTFEELYQHAQSKNFGKGGKEGRKAGRIRIIKWLCQKERIRPYIAPITPVVEATTTIARPILRPTGAISHPEAILRTSDPDLQELIKEAEAKYKKWPAADLLALALQRSYQLLKDSNGKLPSKSIAAMAIWLASWDILKSEREKKWWLGDGIDLVNKAKAMGYQGPSRKYEVIVWLRSTPEASEVEVTEIAEPTPNKRAAAEAGLPHSNRRAKGSKRPHETASEGWASLKFSK
ncbi:uncharacterized protein PAC_10303 [Phialocephala subalpina]|uniref:Uncharacterized protein n=1 Tax=Phialocephala subalpina TaxID=576137 RepID=A0A1L7X5V0_9HELO|nr:uncharacterized protein PAC_10303 [Phialocephala subalpina]